VPRRAPVWVEAGQRSGSKNISTCPTTCHAEQSEASGFEAEADINMTSRRKVQMESKGPHPLVPFRVNPSPQSGEGDQGGEVEPVGRAVARCVCIHTNCPTEKANELLHSRVG